jgi:hypothetical protein
MLDMELAYAKMQVPWYGNLLGAIQEGNASNIAAFKRYVVKGTGPMAREDALRSRPIWRAFIEQNPGDVCAKAIAEEFERELIEYRLKHKAA